jgi:hypothetical protein
LEAGRKYGEWRVSGEEVLSGMSQVALQRNTFPSDTACGGTPHLSFYERFFTTYLFCWREKPSKRYSKKKQAAVAFHQKTSLLPRFKVFAQKI